MLQLTGLYKLCLEQSPMDDVSKNKPSASMTYVTCESKLRSVLRSSMHLCPGNWVATGCAVVYYARADQGHLVQESNDGTVSQITRHRLGKSYLFERKNVKPTQPINSSKTIYIYIRLNALFASHLQISDNTFQVKF